MEPEGDTVNHTSDPATERPQSFAALLDYNATLKIENARLKREIDINRADMETMKRDHGDHRQMHEATIAQFQNRLRIERDEVKTQKLQRGTAQDEIFKLRAEIQSLTAREVDGDIAETVFAKKREWLQNELVETSQALDQERALRRELEARLKQVEEHVMVSEEVTEERLHHAALPSMIDVSRSMRELDMDAIREEKIAEIEEELSPIKETRIAELEDEVYAMREMRVAELEDEFAALRDQRLAELQDELEVLRSMKMKEVETEFEKANPRVNVEMDEEGAATRTEKMTLKEAELAKMESDAVDKINIIRENARYDIQQMKLQAEKEIRAEKEKARNHAQPALPTYPAPESSAPIAPVLPRFVQYLHVPHTRSSAAIDQTTPEGHQQSYEEQYEEFKQFTQDLIVFIYYFHHKIEERFPNAPLQVHAHIDIKFDADDQPYDVVPLDIGFDLTSLGELCETYKRQVAWQSENVEDPGKRMRSLDEMYDELERANNQGDESIVSV